MSRSILRLDELCYVRRGTTITEKSAIKGDIPVIAGGLNFSYKHNAANRNGNVITVSGSGANAGYVNFWSEPIFASDCSTVEAKDDGVDIKYIFYWLRSQQAYINNTLRSGAAQPHVYAKDIAALKVSVLPINEQKRIAKIFDKANVVLLRREEAIVKIYQLAQSLFIDMFGDRKINPKNYPLKKLNEIAAISSGSTPSRSASGFMNGSIPWVKTTEVDGVEIFDTEEKLTEAGLRSIGNKINPVNSIVVAMYGQGKTRGRVGLLKIDAATNQACGVIKPSDNFLPNFMFWQLHLAYSDLRALGRGGNQENLNLQLLGDFKVLLPPLSEQKKYCEFISKLLELKKKFETFDAKTQEILASLNQKAFMTGFNA